MITIAGAEAVSRPSAVYRVHRFTHALPDSRLESPYYQVTGWSCFDIQCICTNRAMFIARHLNSESLVIGQNLDLELGSVDLLVSKPTANLHT